MQSFIVPARNARDLTIECLHSLQLSLAALNLSGCCEFILLDDCSDPVEQVPELFAEFRAGTGLPARIFRFHARQHYTGSFAFGLSRARGDLVFFISNDMHVTPAWLRTVLAVAATDRRIGVVRGVANIVDSHEGHQVLPPQDRNLREDYVAFSEYLAQARGLEHADDAMLSGDAVLVRRDLIERIGVLDTRFFGYMGDPDYGLRARRAGFRLVCAKGAWLKHYGQGHVKSEAVAAGQTMEAAHRRRMELVNAAFREFQKKWGSPPVPDAPRDLNTWPWDDLLKAPAPAGGEFQAPIPESVAREV
jgi:GT2 family glycosyltransferase